MSVSTFLSGAGPRASLEPRVAARGPTALRVISPDAQKARPLCAPRLGLGARAATGPPGGESPCVRQILFRENPKARRPVLERVRAYQRGRQRGRLCDCRGKVPPLSGVDSAPGRTMASKRNTRAEGHKTRHTCGLFQSANNGRLRPSRAAAGRIVLEPPAPPSSRHQLMP